MTSIRCTNPESLGIRHFIVRQGYSWASIYVRPFSSPMDHGGKPMLGAEVLINSDHGVFGYCWTSMGENWQPFLGSLSFDYAMGKFRGQALKVPKPHRESCADIRRYILEERRERVMSKEDARTLWDAADPDWFNDIEPGSFFRVFDERSGGRAYQLDYWEYDFTMNDPAMVQFWERLWKPFAAYLRGDT